jgi:hypothetical protein
LHGRSFLVYVDTLNFLEGGGSLNTTKIAEILLQDNANNLYVSADRSTYVNVKREEVILWLSVSLKIRVISGY